MDLVKIRWGILIAFLFLSMTVFALPNEQDNRIDFVYPTSSGGGGVINLTNVAFTNESNTFDSGTLQTMDNLTVEGEFKGSRQSIKWSSASFSTVSGYLPLYNGLLCSASQCFQPSAPGETVTGSIRSFQVQQQVANSIACKAVIQIRNGTNVLESIAVITAPFTGDEVTTERYKRHQVPFTTDTSNNLNLYYFDPDGRCSTKSSYAGYVEVQYD